MTSESGRRLARIPMRGDDLIEHAAKILQTGRGNNDRVAAPVGILGDAEKPASRILTQIEDEILALDGDIFTFQNGIHL
jgi:hypothetical protein